MGAVGTARAQRAHDREKLGVFATIRNILAYTDHTTPPTVDSLITQSGFFSSQQLQKYQEVFRMIHMAQPEFPRSFLLKTLSLVAQATRIITHEIQFSVGKNFASPYTPRALFAHTISVFDALSRFLAKAKHLFLVTMTRLFLRATIHAQKFCSISWYLVFLPNS